MPILGVDCFVMRLPAGRTAADMVAEVGRDLEVAWSQPLHLYHPQGQAPAYDDPLYPAQPAAKLWNLAGLHRIATGQGVTIAVIDSGVDTRQRDLSGQIAIAQDFTGRPARPEWHGTGVAGIIAAKGGNGAGIVGVAPAARLMALRACWQEGAGARDGATLCDSLSLAKALQFAIDRRAPIVNMSLSGPPDLLLERLIAAGLARGGSVVAAVDPAMADGGFPASLAGVTAVSDRPVMIRKPVYVAPGRDIPTTEPDNRWSIVNGSSYAAAHVSGLLALAREGRPGARPMALADAGGPIDACRALARERNARDCLCGGGC